MLTSLGLQLYEGSASIPVQDFSLCYSPGPEQSQTNQHGKTTPCSSEEPRACDFPILLDVDDKRTSRKHISKYAGDPQLEQYNSPMATPPSFSQPRRSAETPQPQIGQEHYGNDEEGKRRKEKRVRQVEAGKIGNDTRHPEYSDHPHNASNEDVEDPRPVKRRKLLPIPIERLTPPGEDSTTPQVSQLNGVAAT